VTSTVVSALAIRLGFMPLCRRCQSCIAQALWGNHRLPDGLRPSRSPQLLQFGALSVTVHPLYWTTTNSRGSWPAGTVDALTETDASEWESEAR